MSAIKALLHDMVDRVKEHAVEQCGVNGWDIVVECYSDRELENLILHEQCTSVDEAIQRVGEIMKAQRDYENQCRAHGY